ncbi:hypothetical protein INT45_012461, partial [Circinella minor]
MTNTNEDNDSDNGNIIPFIPDEIENTMNNEDREQLLRYIDSEFLDVLPSSNTTVTNNITPDLEQQHYYDLQNTTNNGVLDELLNNIDNKQSQKEIQQELSPRDYQYELFQKAVNENVLAVLDTGSGKTLIAVMLIKHILTKEREYRLKGKNKKITFFLVDRVPLVFQQYNVIKSNCDANIERIVGEMGIDKWSEENWKQIFKENDICVMTAQIFLDILRHGFIEMTQINLIIFDECHHCIKKHPYRLIMKEHYEQFDDIRNRPKIFGMTASPVHGATKSVEKAIFDLERNLDSRVYAIINGTITTVVARAEEEFIPYTTLNEYDDTPLSDQIKSKITDFNRHKRLIKATNNVLKQLGPWCCDQLWKHLLNEQADRVVAQNKNNNKYGLPLNQLVEEEEEENRFIVEAYRLTQNNDNLTGPPNDPDINDSSLFSFKVAKLINLLNELRQKDDLNCIIFVERRHTAVALDLLIKSFHNFDNVIRSDILIGHGTNDDGDIQMTFKKQNQVIQQFKTGELNLLIATNVAEEGLDIQACNVVIRFDFFTTLIGYIQSRGRARSKNSIYYIMVEENTNGQYDKVEEFRVLEVKMKSFCEEHPTRNMYNLCNGIDDNDEDEEDDEDFTKYVYKVENSNAKITLYHAITLIYLYVGSLPSDAFCTLKPIFDIDKIGDGFVCTLQLPINAALNEVTSSIVRSKTKAKHLAAFQAAVQLHKLGALDDHLRPKNMKRHILGDLAPELDENGQVIGSRRRKHIYEKRTPRFWEREQNDEEMDYRNEQFSFENDKDLTIAHSSSWRKEVQHQMFGSQSQQLPDAIETLEDLDMNRNPNAIKSNLSDQSLIDNSIDRLPNTSSVATSKPTFNNSISSQSKNIPNRTSKPSQDTINVFDTEDVEYSADQPLHIQTFPSPTSSGSTLALSSTTALTTPETENTHEHELDVINMIAAKPETIRESLFDVWMTIILIEIKDPQFKVRQMALITWKQLPLIPDFKLFKKSIPFKIGLRSQPTNFQIDRPTLDKLAKFTLYICSAIANKEFQCPSLDCSYFLAPLKTYHTDNIEYPATTTINEFSPIDTIDWNEVNQTIAKEQPRVDSDHLEKYTDDKLLIDFGENSSRPYLIKKICHDLHPDSPPPNDMKIRETNYETFTDYYLDNFKKKIKKEAIRMEQPMIRVQRVQKVMNFLIPIEESVPQEKSQTATFVIPELCKVFWVSASVYQSAILLPSIMTRLDSYLLVKEAGLCYDLPISHDLLLEAFTTPSAIMALNYERLETLGDSILKFISSIRLYIKFPLSDEGELHCLRIRIVSNRALYRAAKRLKIYRYVNSHSFNRRYWRPHHFTSPQDSPKQHQELRQHTISDKTLADIIEASLGAAYLSYGLEAVLHTAIQMQIPFEDIKQWSDFSSIYLAHQTQSKDFSFRYEAKASLQKVNIQKIQETICNYTFHNPLLINEALTHASLPNSTAPCYQRLEFLGDSILDFLATRYLFKKYPKAGPGLLTELKRACVNNHILGIICARNQLHTEIIHCSSELVKALELFHCDLENMDSIDDGDNVGEVWADMTIPKVLGDVVESMLGAVFVDAGFDIAAVETLFEKWMIPIYERHIRPETLNVHPAFKFTTDLQRLGCEGFMFDITVFLFFVRNHTTASTSGESQKCVIFLHGKPLATGAGHNKTSARQDAATKGLLRLQEDPGLLKRVCNCTITSCRNKKFEEEENEDM